MPDFLDNKHVETVLVLKEFTLQIYPTNKQFGYSLVNNIEKRVRNANLPDKEIYQLLKEVVVIIMPHIQIQETWCWHYQKEMISTKPYQLIYMSLSIDGNYGICIWTCS